MSGEAQHKRPFHVRRSAETRRSLRVRRRIGHVAALLLVATGLVVVTGGAASAHNASVSATCAKLSVSLTSYQASGGQNTVKVTVDGATKADTAFGSSYNQTFPFADETSSHTWTVQVKAWDDAGGQKGWSFTKSGTSNPCAPPDACPQLPGTQPPGTQCTAPHADDEKREVRGTPDCTHETVTVEKQKRTRTYTWDGDSWEPGPWSEWTTYSTYKIHTTPEDCTPPDACPQLPGTQPPGTQCTAPHADYEKREVRGTPDCTHETVTVEKQKRTRTYTWDGDSWEPGPWGEWTTYSTYKVHTTPQDCTPPDACPYLPGTQPPGTQCTPPHATRSTATCAAPRTAPPTR